MSKSVRANLDRALKLRIEMLDAYKEAAADAKKRNDYQEMYKVADWVNSERCTLASHMDVIQADINCAAYAARRG
jgi:hypothetical protein